MNEIEEIQMILEEEGFQDIQGAEESMWVLIHKLTAFRTEVAQLKVENKEELEILQKLACATTMQQEDIDDQDATFGDKRVGEVLDRYDEFLRRTGRPQVGIVEPAALSEKADHE